MEGRSPSPPEELISVSLNIYGTTELVSGATELAQDADLNILDGELKISSGILDTTDGDLSINTNADAFSIASGATLKADLDDFGTLTGSIFSKTGNIDEMLSNNGTLELHIDGSMRKTDSIKLSRDADWTSIVSGSGEVRVIPTNLADLYSLTYMPQSGSYAENVMAGSMASGNVTFHGIVANTEESNLTNSSIANGAILNLTGANADHVLLDAGSVDNSGTLNLGEADVSYTSNFNGALTNTTGTTNILSGVNITGATAVDGGSLVVNAAGKTVATKNVDVASGANLNVNAGTLDVSGGKLTVDSGATTFTTATNGTLKMKGDDFITFNQDGTLLAVLDKALENDGTLELTGLADVIGANASRSRKAQLKTELMNDALLTSTSSGTVDYVGVKFDGLYSLTWVDEADSFQNASQNIMAGDFSGNRTVNAAGIVKNTDENPNVTASSIAAGSTLNLSGDNDNNILLDEGSLST